MSRRDRIRQVIHLLDCAALYGEVFGLAAVAEQYRTQAEQLLEVA